MTSPIISVHARHSDVSRRIENSFGIARVSRTNHLARPIRLLVAFLFALIALCGVAATSALAQTCNINTPGKPCSGGSGNPINIMNGNKYQEDIDMPALPGVLGLEIVRHYNSFLSRPGDSNGIVGRGWRLSYETQLFNGDNYLEIREADGTMYGFSCDVLDRQRCNSTDRTRGTVRRLGANGGKNRGAADAAHGSGNDFLWTWNDGRVLRFNQLGQLVQIEAPTGEFVTLQYDARQLLMRVTDPQGRQLHLHYPDLNTMRDGEGFSGVDWIDSPVGRFHFIYGSAMPKGATISKEYLIANLVRVEIPLQSAALQGSVSQSMSDGSAALKTLKGIFSYDGGNNADEITTSSSAAIKRSRVYHFDDVLRPTFLTGISNGVIDSNGKTTEQRYSTYAYNADGKAILSTHPNDVNKVSIDYRSAGETIVTNSLGQPTVYKHAIINSQYRLLEVVGAGCYLCIEPNIRYGYDEHGRQTSVTSLTPQGQPLHTIKTELDYYGRTLKVSRIDYRNGKPLPAQLQVRYEYGPGQGPIPSGIFYPSLVPGKERVKRIKVNALGQPLAVTESGWMPAEVGVPAISTASLTIAQTPATQPTPIERSTTYRYTVINGRSLLTQIDGPLPNGPSNSSADSDITTYKYDARGDFRIESINPGNHFIRIRRDAATGYPIAIETGDGINSPQRLTLINNLRGQPERIARQLIAPQSAQQNWPSSIVDHVTSWFGKDIRYAPSPLVTQIQYDTLGHPKRITRPDGNSLDIITDAAGRATGVRDQDGNIASKQLDSESRLLASLRQSADASAPLDMRTAFMYDTQSRITQVTDATNAVTQYAYSTDGQLTSIIDALQRRTRFDYDADGRLAALIQNADTPERAITRPGYVPGTEIVSSLTAANGATTKNQIDDFGRTLVIDSPDSGRQVAQYDVVDRLVSTTDANGNRNLYTWDAAGNLMARHIDGRDSSGKPAVQQIQYRYLGNRLIAVIDPQQSTEWRYDANGNVVDKTERLARANTGTGTRPSSGREKNEYKSGGETDIDIQKLNDERSLKFTTRYEYDALNRLNATSLASGETVRITYGKASRVQRIELVIKDGRLTRPLATDIQLHPFTGLTSFSHGNGLTTRYERNRRTGQLVTLKVGTSTSTVAQALFHWMPSASAASDKTEEKIKPTEGTSTQPLRDLLYAQHLDYDVAGRIKTIDRIRTGQAAPANEQYGYDALDRLSKVITATEQTGWNYDAVGNRLSETSSHTADQSDTQQTTSSSKQSLSYQPASNRLTALTDAGKTTTYAYDAAGNPTQIGDNAYLYDVTG